MDKCPTGRSVSIYFTERTLRKIDQEAAKQNRSRSDYVEMQFENLFFESTAKPKT